MNNGQSREVFILAGPTAAGKSDLAHHLARTHDWAVLSADAMLVYRGMDIGTAKPTPTERAGIPYGGIDLVTPDQPFNVGAWLDHARAFLRAVPRTQRVLVVGGTGLYIKSLLHGLDAMPETDPAVRAWAESIYEREGLEGLQRACRESDPERYGTLKDTANPRRVMRALELARMGVPMERVWDRGETGTVVVLEMQRDLLARRIEERVEAMYGAGFLEEVRRLKDRYPEWSDTAGMAIGYREALALLQNELTEEEARQEAIRRTRRLARRQMTWFRNQLNLVTMSVDEQEGVPERAGRVYDLWSEHGPCRIAC